jgi:hypothetical protein
MAAEFVRSLGSGVAAHHVDPLNQESNMLHIVLTSLTFVLASMTTAWKTEDGWIASCSAAGCPGLRVMCLSYAAGGKTYYCYRNHDG